MDDNAEARHDQADAMDHDQRSFALHWLAEMEPGAFDRMAAAVAVRFPGTGQS